MQPPFAKLGIVALPQRIKLAKVQTKLGSVSVIFLVQMTAFVSKET